MGGHVSKVISFKEGRHMSARGQRKAQLGSVVIAPRTEVMGALREIATSPETAVTASELARHMNAAYKYSVSEQLAKDKILGRLSDLVKAGPKKGVFEVPNRGEGRERTRYYIRIEGQTQGEHTSSGSSLVSEATRLVQEASALRDVLIETSRALDSFIKRLS